MTGPLRRVLRRFRSAITGRFVTARTARRHPRTTTSETYRDSED
jgi:hypothetical protein